jgi:HNH endonuclease
MGQPKTGRGLTTTFDSVFLRRMSYVYPLLEASEQTKLAVWAKGHIIPNFDSAIWRRDICGTAMKYSEHGNTDSTYGWEIDHIQPEALDGLTVLNNLQPLNWKNNRAKGDTYPWERGT